VVPVVRAAATRVDRLAAAARASTAGRCLARFRAIDGRDRTLALAGQGFTTLVPLLIVGAAFASDDAVARHLIERFRLSGPAAEAVTILFSRPPGATGTITLLGIVVLAYSSLSFTRALQRTWEAAWELPPVGVRGTLHAATGVALLVTQLIALALMAQAFSGWPGAGLVGLVVRLVVATILWLELQSLLLSRRVARTELLPGAVVAGLGQVAAGVYSAVWMPRLIATDAARYGVIGVTFALVTWLIVIAFGVVIAAVVSAELRLSRVRADGLEPGPDPEAVAEPGPAGETATGPGPFTAAAATAPAAAAAAAAAAPAADGRPGAVRIHGRVRAVRRGDPTDSFGVLLLLVVATVVWTAAAPQAGWARALVVALQTATLFGALRAARVGPRVLAAAAGLWGAGALVAVIAAVAGVDAAGVGAALGVVLLCVAFLAVLARVARHPGVSARTAAAAVSAYLLLGLVFTYVYAMLGALGTPPLEGTSSATALNEYLYFAFTTLTTTGFGDLSPTTDVARAVAVLEALLGQLYLVTVLAVVIGNIRPRWRT
jgi:membrane protein